jgi:DNA-binding transcriptional MerR regulator
MTSPHFLTIGAVADRLAIPRWKLAYLIERGSVPGPSLQVPGRRLFSEDDVAQLRQALAGRQADPLTEARPHP